MTSLLDDVKKALGDTYTVERELGGGGMAQVFAAVETSLGRRVAIKVLPPELAETVSADRFRREIQLAAQLQHPHIVPLLTVGQAGRLLYYAMPMVEGETLRQRLNRQKQLQISEVCRIMSEVARALAYAHRQRIVHRDIKPENILLSEGEAQVTDFGIAKALAAATETSDLTTRGLVLGTPAYMAPEQVTADEELDARSDLYALGVVGYEMLTGTPPFSDRSAQALMAAHAVRPPEPISQRRPAVPRQLAALVMQLLEKQPADRPRSADEVLTRLDHIYLQPDPAAPEELPTVPTRKPQRFGLRAIVIALGGAAALALLGVISVARHPLERTAVDPKVVAVIPFRVAGADSSLGYLREGMLDLLATKLSGTEYFRTVDPRALLHAWREAGGSPRSDLDRGGVEGLARTFGAGRILEGEVIGTPHRVLLNARISQTAREPLRASVEGPADSLTSLVDHLVAQLLALGSGEPRDRLATLTSTSLPALRAYLDGRAAYHKGDYYKARDLFTQAMEFDSSFALAGLGHRMAAMWIGFDDLGAVETVSWPHRDRLTRRDHLLLNFWLGRRYPILTPQSESMEDLEVLIGAAPDSPEAWALLGDHTYHYGAQVGMPDPLERSLRAYKRALALDSTFAPTREHLHELYYQLGDSASARQAIARKLRSDSTSQDAAVVRYFARVIIRDTALGAIDLAHDSLLPRARSTVRIAMEYGKGLAEAESVLTLREATVSNATERQQLQDIRWTYYVTRGQPSRAEAGIPHPSTSAARAAALLGALYAESDTTMAQQVSAEIPRVITRPTPTMDGEKVWEQYAVAQYDLAHGRRKAARQTVQAWKGSFPTTDTSLALLAAHLFAMVLDAQLAVLSVRPDALVRLSELDSLLQTAPTSGWVEPAGNLITGQLWYQRGDFVRALASVRRRSNVGLWVPWRYVRCLYVATLRDEARYAALAGDRAGSLRAYRHYLVLRSNPEPTVRPRVEQVRAELSALERESRLAAPNVDVER